MIFSEEEKGTQHGVRRSDSEIAPSFTAFIDEQLAQRGTIGKNILENVFTIDELPHDGPESHVIFAIVWIWD